MAVQTTLTTPPCSPTCSHDRLGYLMRVETERLSASLAARNVSTLQRQTLRSAAAASDHSQVRPHTTRQAFAGSCDSSRPLPARPSSATQPRPRYDNLPSDLDPDLDPDLDSNFPNFVDYAVQLLGGSSWGDLEALTRMHLYDAADEARFKFREDAIDDMRDQSKKPQKPVVIRRAVEELSFKELSRFQERRRMKVLGVYRFVCGQAGMVLVWFE